MKEITTPRSCPTAASVGQLENRIVAAAKAMERCEKELTKAEAKEQKAEADYDAATAKTTTANAKLIGKAFVLGGELDALAKKMEATKGKHKDTFRKRAIGLLGNKNAVYRPWAIYRYLTSKGIATEEAAVKYANDGGEAYRTLAETAQRKEQQSKVAKSPGRKPKGGKTTGRAKPVARKASAAKPQAKAQPQAEDQPQPPITDAEFDALTRFVEAVGGLMRADFVYTTGIVQLRELAHG